MKRRDQLKLAKDITEFENSKLTIQIPLICSTSDAYSHPFIKLMTDNLGHNFLDEYGPGGKVEH